MKGKILDFSATAGGIILAEDGQRYMFDAAEWKEQVLPKSGNDVDFGYEDGKVSAVYLDVYRAQSVASNGATNVVSTINQSVNEVTDAVGDLAKDISNVKVESLFYYFKRAFTKDYANFQGRARRREFWGFALFQSLIMLALYALLAICANNDTLVFICLGLITIFILAGFIPSLAVAIRRLHDTGRSGWFYLINFVPLIGGFWYLFLVCQDSDKEKNQFGENPKRFG